MQTFLPYPDFQKSAQCLDNKRLGKQRVEAWQILNALLRGKYSKCNKCEGAGSIFSQDQVSDHYFNYSNEIKCDKCKGNGEIKTPWYNHPAVQMWKGYEKTLAYYGAIICLEWNSRGFKDTLLVKFDNMLGLLYGISGFSATIASSERPSWLGNEKFHASHRSNLLRKNPEHYKQFGWKEPNDLDYWWPTKET